MRAIVGIGNPGKKYELTRHNIGFMFVDFIAQSLNLSFVRSKNEYDFAKGEFNGSPFLLIKPTTYVNLSGYAVDHVVQHFNIAPEDVLIIIDDINLPVGKVKINPSGGDGGHNGLNSIIEELNTKAIPRVKIGIGNNFESGKMADYVLSKFNDDELKLNLQQFDSLIKHTFSFFEGGIKEMLNAYSKQAALIKKEEKLKNADDDMASANNK